MITSPRIAAGIVMPVITASALAFAGGLPAGLAAQAVSRVAAHGIAYDVTGDPDGPVIVLIHGFSLDRRMWDAQVAAFSDRARVVRYDLRGHGASAPPAAPYTGYDDLHALLDELGVARATLVGLSAGAVVALDFALVYPSRVEALVLAAPGVSGFRAPAMPWLEPVFEAVGAGDAARAAWLWAETPLMKVHAGGAAADAARTMALDNAALWSMARLERPLDPPALDRLAAIAVPTLVVVGDRDLPHILEVAGLLAERIPGAQRIMVPDAGHLVNLDAPAAFERALASFLPFARPPAGIDGLAWLAGCWEGELASGTTYEESWLAPRAGTMLGVARATREGQASSFEFMRIYDDAGTPVFAAQPSGRPATLFRAAAAGAGRVSFENPAHDFPQRILYRLERPDRLLARIEGERDGESRVVDFPLRRVACPGEDPPMTTDNALAALRRAYMEAFNRGDADAVAALHTEESVSMSAGMPAVVGREAIRDLMRASLAGAPPGLRFEFEPVEVRAADGWAVERGVTKPAGPFPAGKYVMLYERGDDGAWRIAWTITNTDAPPPPREP